MISVLPVPALPWWVAPTSRPGIHDDMAGDSSQSENAVCGAVIGSQSGSSIGMSILFVLVTTSFRAVALSTRGG